MTDLVRPVGGQSLFDSDGAGTLSTTMMDSYADLIEENEEALLVRTSPQVVTVDQYSDIAELTVNTAEATTGWYANQAVIDGIGSISASSTLLTSTTAVFTADAVGRAIRVNGAGASGQLITTVASFTDSTHVVLTAPAVTSVSGTPWDHDTSLALGPSTSATHSQGSFSIQSYQKSAAGDLSSALYVNLTEAGYPTGLDVIPGMNVLVDILLAGTVGESPAKNAFTRYAVTLASGVDMTGTLVSRTYSQEDVTTFLLNTWYTVTVPVSSLTNIKSIGLKKVLSTGTSSARARWQIDNIRRASTTPLDQAYWSQPAAAVIIPPDYTTTATQAPIEPLATRSVLDLRPTKIHGGVKWLNDYFLDTTGATDITDDLQTVLNGLTEGDTLVGSPDHVYLVNGTLDFNVPGITFDFNGAKLYQDARGIERICILDAARVTIKNGAIFGYTASDPASSTGSTMTTVAGTPSNSLTTKVLATVGDEVRIPVIAGGTITHSYSRDRNFQNRFDFKLHDTIPTAGDCVFQIKDAKTGAVLNTQTQTLDTTPTYYTFYYTPGSLTQRLIVTVKKAAGTGNVVVTDFIHYGWTSFNTINEENFGFAVTTGADDCVVENFLIEGVSGDGIGVATQPLTVAANRFIARNVLIRNVGRQGIAPCGGKNHQFINCTVIFGARHAVDFEPETSPDAIDGCSFVNFWIIEPLLLAFSSAQGWSRTHNIKVQGMYIQMNSQAGAVGGGYNGAHFSDVTIVRTDDSTLDDAFPTSLTGKNIVLDNWKTDEGIETAAGTPVQVDDAGITHNVGMFTLRNIQFTKHPHIGYISVGTPQTHLENITADSSSATTNTAYSLGGIGLASDTTYTNVNLALHRTSLPNSWKGIATGSTWFPTGLNLRNEPVSRVRALSGTTTRGNNLGAMSQAITAASTTATVTFATKTSQNITNFTLASSTGGTLTPSTTYYYRVAGRPRQGGPLLALAEKSVTLGGSGTATQLNITTQYLVSSGFYVDGLTIYRGTVSGTYTTRWDIVPTADLNAWGNTGTGTPIMSIKDLGITVDKVTNQMFHHGYTFPYSVSTGVSLVPADETGFEPNAIYAVFLEPSWHTTWRISAKRTNGFDIEFGVPCPTGGGTFSWMIARF